MVTLPKSWPAILSNIAGLTSRSVGSQPVPGVHQCNVHACVQCAHTSINDLKVDADLLASTFIHPCGSDLLSTQRVLVWVTAGLNIVIEVVRYGDNGVVVRGGDTTGSETRTVVGEISSEVIGVGGKRQESRPVTIVNMQLQTMMLIQSSRQLPR